MEVEGRRGEGKKGKGEKYGTLNMFRGYTFSWVGGGGEVANWFGIFDF